MPEYVKHFAEALEIIKKYAPHAYVIIEEQYYLVNVGKQVPSDSDIRLLSKLGWNYEDGQIYKIR